MPDQPRYVLITAARNEETLIEATIQAVVAQKIRPTKWIIVSDGSTDRTDEIVKQYTVRHEWIELIRMPERRDRQFAAKAHCVNSAYAVLKNAPFDIVGNIDADVTFAPDYFEFLLEKFVQQPRLGVAGTPYIEPDTIGNQHSYAQRHSNLNHVSGPCQIFRRECFEDVGGYVPIKLGAIDWVAVTTARMRGWLTITFVEKTYFHHRKMGTAESGILASRFRYGQKAYYVGGHPLWESLRGAFQIKERPVLLGGLYFLAGYWWACITRMERPVSRDLIRFHQGEQLVRLRGLFKRSGIKNPPGFSNDNRQRR
jgi:cellulose synthase/poly-beta-1,6-N-acetylglucosamine synthase-like glycosyltransferase